MGTLNPFDASVVRTLRDHHVLENEEATKIPLSEGAIIIRCPDGDQMLDRILHDCELVKSVGGKLRFHLLTAHGGCMALAPDSPLYPGMGADKLKLLEIDEARRLKGMTTISAEIHAPCGKAASLGLTLVHQIVLMMAAKPRIKHGRGEDGLEHIYKVICRVHVMHADGVKRTYFISRGRWMRFWQDYGRAMWGTLFVDDPHPNSLPPQAGHETIFEMQALSNAG